MYGGFQAVPSRGMSLLAVANLGSDTGLAADEITMNFAVKTNITSYTSAHTDGVIAAIVSFFNDVPPGTLPIVGGAATLSVGNYLSPNLDHTTDGCSVLVYDLEGKLAGIPHGSPIDSGTFTLDASTSPDPMPHEVALCLTLEAVGRAAAAVESPTGGTGPTGVSHPKARHTGRIFVGPLNFGGTSANIGGQARPAEAFRAHCLLALAQLDAALGAVEPTFDLGVWSRADQVVRAVSHVSVDDAWDTIRSRGVDRVTRTRIAVAEA